jgi:hypothetical protein
VAEVSRGRSTIADPVGRAEHRERSSTLSSSRDEQERQNALDKGTAGQAKQVKPAGTDQRAEPSPVRDEGKSSAELWGQIWANQNVVRALERVERNGGAPGIDGMTVEELRPYLREQWLEIRKTLDEQTYKPQPVRRVEIPKADGGGEAVRDTESNGSLSPTSDRTGTHASV